MIACDQTTASTAAQLIYTGSGARVGSQPLIDPGSAKPVHLGPAGTTAGATLAFLPPPIPTNTPIAINMPGQCYVRVDNATNFAWCGNGGGTTSPELWYAVDPSDPSSKKLVRPGQKAVLMSLQTGLFARLQLYTGDTGAAVAAKKAPPPPGKFAASSRPPRPAAVQPMLIRVPPGMSSSTVKAGPPPAKPRPPPLASPGRARPVPTPRPPPSAAAARRAAVRTASVVKPTSTRTPASSPSPELGLMLTRDPRSVHSSSTSTWGVLADQPIASATLFTYTVSGLTFQGQPLKAAGPSLPILWSNQSSPSGAAGAAFVPAPGELA
jgi:hypothetical protein